LAPPLEVSFLLGRQGLACLPGKLGHDRQLPTEGGHVRTRAEQASELTNMMGEPAEPHRNRLGLQPAKRLIQPRNQLRRGARAGFDHLLPLPDVAAHRQQQPDPIMGPGRPKSLEIV